MSQFFSFKAPILRIRTCPLTRLIIAQVTAMRPLRTTILFPGPSVCCWPWGHRGSRLDNTRCRTGFPAGTFVIDRQCSIVDRAERRRMRETPEPSRKRPSRRDIHRRNPRLAARTHEAAKCRIASRKPSSRGRQRRLGRDIGVAFHSHSSLVRSNG